MKPQGGDEHVAKVVCFPQAGDVPKLPQNLQEAHEVGICRMVGLEQVPNIRAEVSI